MPDHDQAWFECQPRGYCGFGGSFTVSDLSAWITTTQGLAAGSTFSEETLSITTATAAACEGVSFFPVTSGFEVMVGSRAVSTSLVSTPSVMTSALSVAVTWSSSTTTTQSSTTATTSAVTTRAATHTLAMESAITGNFISSDPITFNSTARTEQEGFSISGGYMVGDNHRGEAWTAFIRHGCARWTEYSAGQSTAALTHSSSGTEASVSFTIPSDHAAVITVEPMLTARWDTAGSKSVFSSQQHPKHS